MKNKLNRRNFIKKGTQVTAGCCMIMASGELLASALSMNNNTLAPDPKKINTYCGYHCKDTCAFKVATIENDIDKKKKVYKDWKIKEKGIEFDADKIFCYGCKVEEEKIGPVVAKCEVRKCCNKKGFDCCIECDRLESCEKGVFKRFPDFHKRVVEKRKKYLET